MWSLKCCRNHLCADELAGMQNCIFYQFTPQADLYLQTGEQGLMAYHEFLQVLSKLVLGPALEIKAGVELLRASAAQEGCLTTHHKR